MNKVKVFVVREAPNLIKPAMIQGLRDVASAEHWGEKNHFPEVYLLKQRERGYAERAQLIFPKNSNEVWYLVADVNEPSVQHTQLISRKRDGIHMFYCAEHGFTHKIGEPCTECQNAVSNVQDGACVTTCDTP